MFTVYSRKRLSARGFNPHSCPQHHSLHASPLAHKSVIPHLNFQISYNQGNRVQESFSHRLSTTSTNHINRTTFHYIHSIHLTSSLSYRPLSHQLRFSTRCLPPKDRQTLKCSVLLQSHSFGLREKRRRLLRR